jgi:hypothetical protein
MVSIDNIVNLVIIESNHFGESAKKKPTEIFYLILAFSIPFMNSLINI